MVKGEIKSQSQFEKEEKYTKLLKESFLHGEITQEQAANALKIIGFGVNAAAATVKEWASNNTQPIYDNTGTAKKRLKELASLEKYFIKTNLGKKKYDEMLKKLRIKVYIQLIDDKKIGINQERRIRNYVNNLYRKIYMSFLRRKI